MKVKSEKTKLIIWAVVALVIGVIIGMIITNATAGNAKGINTNLNAYKVPIGEKLYSEKTGELILTKEDKGYRIAEGYIAKKIGNNLVEISNPKDQAMTYTVCTCPMEAIEAGTTGECTDHCTTGVISGLVGCSGSCEGNLCSSNHCQGYKLLVLDIK